MSASAPAARRKSSAARGSRKKKASRASERVASPARPVRQLIEDAASVEDEVVDAEVHEYDASPSPTPSPDAVVGDDDDDDDTASVSSRSSRAQQRRVSRSPAGRQKQGKGQARRRSTRGRTQQPEPEQEEEDEVAEDEARDVAHFDLADGLRSPPPSSPARRTPSSNSPSAPISPNTRRKNSEARKEQQRVQKANEAWHYEKTFKEHQAMQEAKARAQRRGWCKTCFYLIITMFLLLSGVALILLSSSPPSNETPADFDAALSSSLHSSFPSLSHVIDRTLLPAIRQHALNHHAHVQSKRAIAAATDDDDDDGSTTLRRVGQLPVLKPLVLVFASNVGSPSPAHAIADKIAQFARNDTAATAFDLAQACRRVKQPTSRTTPYSPNLKTIDVTRLLNAAMGVNGGGQRALEVARSDDEDEEDSSILPAALTDSLHHFFPSIFPPSSTSSPLSSSLRSGVILIPSTSSLPRSAAESFHLFVDDVVAPRKRAAFLFDVPLDGSMARLDARTAVTETLRWAWTTKTDDEKQPIEPLLSRIVRNVIDVRT